MNLNLICCKKATTLLACLFFSITLFAQQSVPKVTLQGKQITYKEAFEKIERQTKLLFAYNESKFDQSQKIDADFINQPLDKVLKSILSKTQFTYKINAGSIVILPRNTPLTRTSVQKKISGVVFDEEKVPLVGVSLVIKGSSNGTITDIDGNFSIEASDNDMLQVSYIGFQSQDMKIISNKNNCLSPIRKFKIINFVGWKKKKNTQRISKNFLFNFQMSMTAGVML